MDWITHEEDVWFDFRGDEPEQLTPGRYYKGTVDGYADFGVFIDLAPGVTGLLHRSELDRRLESLDWEPGDAVFVQVKNVRENGDVDLAWSKRQSEDEFRGARIDTPGGPEEGEPLETEEAEEEEPSVTRTPTPAEEEAEEAEAEEVEEAEAEEAETEEEEAEEAEVEEAAEAAEAEEAAEEAEEREYEEPEPTGERERTTIETLSDHVGEAVRIEGEVVSARQTGGPTVFEVRDETGVVDCAAFVEPGVRAYPKIEVGDLVRLDGEVEVRRGELQIETGALTELEGEEAETVERRLSDALTAEARPEAVMPLADHDAVVAVDEQLLDAAEAVRRAVLESRPIVVRHAATADGYVAGAAIERAVLPLIREEHATADAEYHYFSRRPLDEPVYDLDAATNDATRMLQDRDRHDEKLPLVLLVGTGSTAASSDGLGLLGVYGTERVVVDAAAADDEVAQETEVLVNPGFAGVEAEDLSTTALSANLAAAVNDEVRDDLHHLPAVSYWADTPDVYLDLATEAGFEVDYLSELREAVALEAYYQSYEEKRELITDLLFEDGSAATRESGEPSRSLASHVSEQFRTKLQTELDTAEANLTTHETGGVEFQVLDADAYTHRFDFPPTTLLLDELHRRNTDGEDLVTLGLGMDELYLRGEVDVREVANTAREISPNAGITAVGIRQGRIEFLSGAREDVKDAVIAAVAEQF